MIIDLEKFVKAEQPLWEELDGLVERLERSGRKTALGLEQAKRFQYLFERAAADLSRLQTYAAEPETVGYLQRLVARAYAELHAESHRGPRLRLVHWFLRDFPAAVRRHARALAFSIVLTLVGAVAGGALVLVDAEAKAVIMPFPHLLMDPSERVAQEEEAAEEGGDLESGKSAFASFLMTHNTKVSIFAMALGLTFGIGTGVLIFYNGVILGAVVADFVAAGESVFLAGWLLPHGSIEIPCILIAGQAGFVLGQTLLGRGTEESLAERMRAVRGDIATLIGGVAVMLVWAGLIESFVSQYHNKPWLPYEAKIAFGLVEFALLVAFLVYGGRGRAGVEGDRGHGA